MSSCWKLSKGSGEAYFFLVNVNELQTPALLLDVDALAHNVALMASRLPGERLRPHVKAHKSTALASFQRANGGHQNFTAATIREVEGLCATGLGHDVLLANEVLDAHRLGALAAAGHRVTLAVDSAETLAAAVVGGVREVMIDINVGLPRCGASPDAAGVLADSARRSGLTVRGVMGYEGHLMMVMDEAEQSTRVEKSMATLLAAHEKVGGELISAGGTGTHRVNRWANEIQAGSYALMDSAYSLHSHGFRQAITLLGTVLHVNRARGYAIADVGLKANGMDHGNPVMPGYGVRFLSDEHITFGLAETSEPFTVGVAVAETALPGVGDRVRVVPAHCDPTVAYHNAFSVVRGDDVVDRWDIDLRGW